MDDQLRKKLAAKHQRCAFPTNPQEDKKGITIFDYACIHIATGLAAANYGSDSTIAKDAVNIALAVFEEINREGF